MFVPSGERITFKSLLVTFIYGSLVWGVLPIEGGISWESHLLGSLAGIITAFHFRKEGPAPKRYEWEDDPEEEDEIIKNSDDEKPLMPQRNK